MTYAKKLLSNIEVKINELTNQISFNLKSSPVAYGYINAKIRGWKRRMLKKKDLELLAEVNSFFSVIDLLQKTTYGDVLKKELELKNSEHVISGIENLLWKSLTRQFNYIYNNIRYQDKETLKFIFKYYDPKNLRTVLLAKHKKISFSEIESQLLPVGILTNEILHAIYSSQSFSELISILKKSFYKNLIDEYLINNKLDKKMDKTFFSDLEQILSFCNFFEFKIYDTYLAYNPYMNTKEITKIFKEYVDGLNYIIMIEGLKQNKDFDDLKLFKNCNIDLKKAERTYQKKQDLSKILKYDMRKIISNEFDSVKLESLINTYFYFKLSKIFYKESLSINSIASYMFLKLYEYSRLLAIIKAKRYGLRKEEIPII